ncbi:MAG: hypothetical protein H0V89_08715, partial [Deltaproteobacteria bacterium]|nr:hypothetical protein [Deltaproteobacteria bacterium]
MAALVACAGSSGRSPSPSSPSPSDPSPAFVTEIATTVADLDASTRLFKDTLGAEVVDGEETSGPEVDALLGVSGAR